MAVEHILEQHITVLGCGGTSVVQGGFYVSKIWCFYGGAKQKS
jgi:uncharacterized integral membrane protein